MKIEPVKCFSTIRDGRLSVAYATPIRKNLEDLQSDVRAPVDVIPCVLLPTADYEALVRHAKELRGFDQLAFANYRSDCARLESELAAAKEEKCRCCNQPRGLVTDVRYISEQDLCEFNQWKAGLPDNRAEALDEVTK